MTVSTFETRPQTLPADPAALSALLDELRTPAAFWELIAPWVSDSHLQRRQAYYRARFERDNTDTGRQLFWLATELYADATGQDVFFFSLIGRRSRAECPYSSRVALDEALAEIAAFASWPDELTALMGETHRVLADLVDMGIMPPDVALERLKAYTRNQLALDYALPVLPLT